MRVGGWVSTIIGLWVSKALTCNEAASLEMFQMEATEPAFSRVFARA